MASSLDEGVEASTSASSPGPTSPTRTSPNRRPSLLRPDGAAYVPRPVIFLQGGLLTRLRWFVLALVGSGLLACRPGDDAGAGEEDSTLEDVAESVGEIAATGGESAESMEGRVTFTIDGQAYDFDHVVADETHSFSVSTAVRMKPDAAATETFSLNIMGIDLDDYEYPTTLPPEEAGTSVRTAMMMVGFGFVDPEGRRWAGTGDLRVESFQDDVLVATFGETTLLEPEGMEPGPTLSDGRIRVEFD